MGEAELNVDSEALTGLLYQGVVGTEKRSSLHMFHYDPAQDHKILPGKKYEDPRGGTRTVKHVDRQAGHLVLRAGNNVDVSECVTLLPTLHQNTTPLQAALQNVAKNLLANDFDSVGLALLTRQLPQLAGTESSLPAVGADVLALCSLGPRLQRSFLPVQGPPGAGKTYVGARMVVTLLKAGKHVALTATSHRVITNLLAEVIRVAREWKVDVRAVQKTDDDSLPAIDGVERGDNEFVEAKVAEGYNLAAGTAWLLVRPPLRQAFDTVVVDEAGQMSLANVIAVSVCATNLIQAGR